MITTRIRIPRIPRVKARVGWTGVISLSPLRTDPRLTLDECMRWWESSLVCRAERHGYDEGYRGHPSLLLHPRSSSVLVRASRLQSVLGCLNETAMDGNWIEGLRWFRTRFRLQIPTINIVAGLNEPLGTTSVGVITSRPWSEEVRRGQKRSDVSLLAVHVPDDLGRPSSACTYHVPDFPFAGRADVASGSSPEDAQVAEA